MRLSAPAMAARGDRGRRGRRRRRRRHRHGRHGDALLRRRRARARGRHRRHRLAQPEGVHGDEDRAARGASRRRRLGPARRSATARWPGQVRGRLWTARHGERGRHLAARSSSACSRSSTSRRSSRSGSSSTPRTGWRARCCRRCSSGSPIDAVTCYFEPDGSFPNHEPNPLLPENREFIVAKTLEEDADFGVAFDGDADRCFFVDDTGEFVPGDFATALFAESMLAQGARREGDLRRPRELGRAGDVERAGGVAADQPRRPRVHQAPHAQGGRRLRRRGVGPLLLPRLLPGRLGRRAVPAHARARLPRGQAALRDPPPLPRALLHHRARSTRPSSTCP